MTFLMPRVPDLHGATGQGEWITLAIVLVFLAVFTVIAIMVANREAGAKPGVRPATGRRREDA